MQAYPRVSMGHWAWFFSHLTLCSSSASQDVREEDEILALSLDMRLIALGDERYRQYFALTNSKASHSLSQSTPIGDLLCGGQTARPQHSRRHPSVVYLSNWPEMWAQSIS